MGMASYGAMGGRIPLSYSEIDAYLRSTETTLTGDEVLTIRKMSEAYCSQVNNADPQAVAPYYTGEKAKAVIQPSRIVNAFAGIATIRESPNG